MTMSARLIQTLHEKLGNEGADDMMAWMEETQRTSWHELRELMDLKLERFDARMGERLAEQRVEFGARLTDAEQRLAARIDGLAARIDGMDGKVSSLKVEVADRISSSLKWNVGLWLTTLAAIGALRFVH